MQSANSSSSGKNLPPFLRRAIAIRTTERSPLQKLLLHTLNSRSDKFGVSWPAIDQLELDTNLARSTVIKIMGELRSIGLVIATRTGACNRRNVYKLNLFPKDTTARAGVPVNPGKESQGKVIHKSGRRTCTSPADVSTSPADRPVPSDSPTCPSFKSSIKRIIEEEVHTQPDSKRLDQYVQWSVVLDNIDLPDQSIATWLSQFKPVDLDDAGYLTIETDIEYALQWVRGHYLTQLNALKVVTRLNSEVPLETSADHIDK